jgi:hypothetical protein
MLENKHNCVDKDQEEVEHDHEAIERLGPISVSFLYVLRRDLLYEQ